ncbi:MAG TPA: DUF4288 domain-containing protein [Chthonomonadaceae bacterium]|nr:DUF4288 domain-containing protein [Chthonomonadaceae bacterium]
MTPSQGWYSVKCLFRHENDPAASEGHLYEERIIVLRAQSLDDALNMAELEAKSYAGDGGDVQYCNFASAYHIADDELTERTEVYSLLRQSPLQISEYVDRYYDEGTERVQRG